jgi:hypothetical protein
MTARTSESGPTCLADWSILVIGNSMPPRDPNATMTMMMMMTRTATPNQMKMNPRSSENPTSKNNRTEAEEALLTAIAHRSMFRAAAALASSAGRRLR